MKRSTWLQFKELKKRGSSSLNDALTCKQCTRLRRHGPTPDFKMERNLVILEKTSTMAEVSKMTYRY